MDKGMNECVASVGTSESFLCCALGQHSGAGSFWGPALPPTLGTEPATTHSIPGLLKIQYRQLASFLLSLKKNDWLLLIF